MKYSKLFSIVLGLCCAVAGVLFILAKRQDGGDIVITPSAGSQPQGTEAAAGAPAGVSNSAKIAVHVCGAVEEPGVYYLAPDARVADAIEAAGGFSADADRDWLNLAEPLTDGVQVRVPTVLEGEELASAEAASRAALIDINTAGAEELMTLPGIGESRALAIIAYRETNGPFAEITDIMRVSGIKEAAFEKIKDRIRTGG